MKFQSKPPLINLAVIAAIAIIAMVPSHLCAQALDRSVLPIPDPGYPPITQLDARNATPPPRFEVKAPSGAPNVLIILLDDMGFGQPSTFGGPINMPTLDRLAKGGLRYNEFHVTALCSPTRAALLTGRNHHMANTGAVMDVATAFPGNTGVRPNSIAPLAEILRLNGYSTAAFGKWHQTPGWEVSPSGPTDRWPTREGFDKFYGFMGGETNQWAPLLYDGMTQIEPLHDPKYHFMTDMTDHAISWMRYEKALTPDKPFFIYFAPGATHAPHQVPKDWIAKYKGKFDMGWDRLREETLARQKQLGVVPPDTKLAPKPAAIKDWSALTPDEKKLFARQMEVYAGFGEMADYEIGRLIQAVQDIGQLDNTIVFYIAGDNGSSAEGGMNGVFNENTFFNGVAEPIEAQLKNIDKLGGPMAYGHYAAGWAVAGDTPFTWTKQVASNFGGTRDGMVVYWPKGIKSKGGLRSQFHHVIDVAPTILEVAGLPEPRMVDGIAQTPIQGVSMAYTFDDAQAKSRHVIQYFEIAGNRAIYHDGWLAGTVHRAPWEREPRAMLENDKWELYNTDEDFSLANDLASSNSTKLKEMQDLFLQEAVKNHVLPIDDRGVERLNPALAGRPDLMAGRTSLTVYSGMTGMMESAFINIKNRSYSITADVEIPKKNALIICQGGRFGGWTLYLKNARPTFTYNWVGLNRYTISGKQPVAPGKATIRFEFTTDGGKLGAGGTGSIFVNGAKVATGRIENTNGLLFSADEGADVGIDEGTPVTEDYAGPDNRFTGKIDQVTIDLKPVGADIKDKVDKATQELMMDKAAED
ncbi:MAG TPA: arylsulfatase [Candidatus Binataceae bacterium]|nr:arylsulfatase [Candidatus Binataceae bacterium]